MNKREMCARAKDGCYLLAFLIHVFLFFLFMLYNSSTIEIVLYMRLKNMIYSREIEKFKYVVEECYGKCLSLHGSCLNRYLKAI
ncbi:hypothetical protein HanXRQr2_Chr03g0128151 [Helianthus annuus]|uniref:Transmembrane protein n=1 Tax=Helianthus annuus TaxID=4232 RepID=A0A9K3JK17_HELAN|nr:hypothetical protein HanXRQr2_Chr03g0128151 [Helianthus annuus]